MKSKYLKQKVQDYFEEQRHKSDLKKADKINLQRQKSKEKAKQDFMLKLLENAKAMNEARESIEQLNTENKKESEE